MMHFKSLTYIEERGIVRMITLVQGLLRVSMKTINRRPLHESHLAKIPQGTTDQKRVTE